MSPRRCCWTYIIQYAQQAINGSLALGGYLLQISLLIFLASRFFHDLADRPRSGDHGSAALGFFWPSCSAVFAMISPNMAASVAVVAIFFCLSLMFPTIYGVAFARAWPGHEVRCRWAGHGHRRRRHHAAGSGHPSSTRPAPPSPSLSRPPASRWSPLCRLHDLQAPGGSAVPPRKRESAMRRSTCLLLPRPASRPVALAGCSGKRPARLRPPTSSR